jgi:hypothetical protein
VVKAVLKGGKNEHSLANRFRVLSNDFWEALALQWSAHGLLQMTNQPFGKLQSFKEYHTAWSLTNDVFYRIDMSRPGSDAKQRHHALELSAMHGCMGSGWDVSNACNVIKCFRKNHALI